MEDYLNALLEHIGDDDFFIKAYNSVFTNRIENIHQAKHNLKGIVISPGIPFKFYDTISKLVSNLPTTMRRSISNLDGIRTVLENESLKVSEGGTWQIVWNLGETVPQNNRYIGIDWYVPPDISKAPIIPDLIMDFIGGSASLYKNKLYLPSASTLLIALEAVIWDRLKNAGVSRDSERIMYGSTKWNYKVIGSKFTLEIDGGDKDISTIPLSDPIRIGQIRASLDRIDANHSTIKLTLDRSLIEFLSPETVLEREVFPSKGFAEALQRARTNNILDSLPSNLDEVLYRLRNGIIHLSCDGKIDPPVPNPSGAEIANLNDLRSQDQFTREIITIVVLLINSLYL
ncbi:hypothetical protein [Deinococcus saxicola]|uniref:hypothetical protein n=1 Tax=Deinococcus saxicola TaxID=249406 RepID=UPI003D0AD3D3